MARQRAPSQPPVTGPTAAPQDTQPVTVATGQPYGERQALEGAQQAVPLPATPPGSSPSPGSAAAPPGAMPGAMPSMEGLFGASQVPGPGGPLPPDAGRQFVPQDPDMLLKAIYQAYPHPEIARLMRALR